MTFEKSPALSPENIEKIWQALPARSIIEGLPFEQWQPALRMAFARALVKELTMPDAPVAWDGVGLPPVGAEVLIRHASDDDDHLCVVTGIRVEPALNGNVNDYRVFVNVVYKNTDVANARLLADIRPAGSGVTAQPRPAPAQPMVYQEEHRRICEYEAVLETIANSGWTLAQVQELARRTLDREQADSTKQTGVRRAILTSLMDLVAFTQQMEGRIGKPVTESDLFGLPEIVKRLQDALNETARLEGRPVPVPVKAYEAYAIMRQREDESNGKEYFFGATWHDGTQPSRGERIVPGWFVSKADVDAHGGLGPRVLQVLNP